MRKYLEVVGIAAMCAVFIFLMGCAAVRKPGEGYLTVNDGKQEVLLISKSGRHIWLAPKDHVADALVSQVLAAEGKAKAAQADKIKAQLDVRGWKAKAKAAATPSTKEVTLEHDVELCRNQLVAVEKTCMEHADLPKLPAPITGKLLK